MGCEPGRYACFGFPILELARAHARGSGHRGGGPSPSWVVIRVPCSLRVHPWSTFIKPFHKRCFLFFKLSPNCVPMTVPSVEEILGTLQIIVCPGKVAVQWGKASD